MKNLPVLQYGIKIAMEKKDLEVAFHPSLQRAVSAGCRLRRERAGEGAPALVLPDGSCCAGQCRHLLCMEQPCLLCVSQWEAASLWGLQLQLFRSLS